MRFVHLHTHSHYSLLEAVPKIKPLVKRVKELGMDAVALTDHGALYGAIEFYETAKKEGVKPILGMEANLAPRGMSDKQSGIDDKVAHLTLLTENIDGYKNLMKLSSLGFQDGFYYKPRIDRQALARHSKGIIALSGCLRGEIPRAAAEHDLAKAERLIREYQEIFGPENFFIELVYHPDMPLQSAVNAELIELAKKIGAPLVATRDAHYLHPEDKEIQRIAVAIAQGRKIDEMREDGALASLLGPEEMADGFRDVPEAIENTGRIADRCELNLELGKFYFPICDLPPGKTADEHLRERAESGLREREPEITQEMDERLNYELGVIQKKGYAAYFLIVADFLNWARAQKIITTTRGSAAGSLVSYAVGITTVNPLFFKLPFERFLNPYRPSAPDIDMDFADTRRDEVIDYAVRKYGREKVAQICTFGAMLARASVRDVGRALGYPYEFCDRMAKLIPFGSQGFPMTLARALRESEELKQVYDSNPDARRLIDFAEKLEGNARHISVHAAGVVISPTELTDFTPVQREPGGGERVITQYEMRSVESAGLVKMDFLGIRNLSILEGAMKLVEQIKGQKIDVQKLPFEDEDTYKMLGRGETTGLFQLGGSGMTRYLVELKPSNIFDIMAMVALFRPGPMESIPEFIRRKHNPGLIRYMDPRMEPILNRSYGVITYQDDVLLIAIHLAGYGWEEADKLRKAMGKKIPEEMAKQKDKFIKGCIEHGKIPESTAHEIWRLIEPFAAYGFNKCLSGDTVIVDADSGQRFRVDSLYHSIKKPRIWTLNNNLKLEARRVKSIVSNGLKPVFEIITRTGRKIRATEKHKFLTDSGWKELWQLKKGVRVAVPRLYPKIKSYSSMRRHELIALGYLLSEGNLCHPSGIYFYSTSRKECMDFAISAKKFKNTRLKFNYSKSAISVYVGKVHQGTNNGLKTWVQALGLAGKKAIEKSFPDCVFFLPTEQLSVLLGRLWQGDGCIYGGGYGMNYYATSSRNLAQELQHLLLRLDILSVIHHKQFKYRGGYKEGWVVIVSRHNNLARFAETIGKNMLADKREVLNAIIAQRKRTVPIGSIVGHGTFDTIPAAMARGFIIDAIQDKKFTYEEAAWATGVAKRLFSTDKNKVGYTREVLERIGGILESKDLKNYSSSDLLWDKVMEINSCGTKETFDVCMPAPHNFIANDFVVHNSHASSYAAVAYQTAYMKAHFPAEYMTAVLTAESGNIETVAEMVEECRKMGISVLPPDINESFANFTYINDKTIRFGLVAIKNLGADVAESFIRARKTGGKFADLADFARRLESKSFNKKSLEALIRSGAMDCFGERNLLLANIEAILAFRRAAERESENNQTSLFGSASRAKISLRPAPPAPNSQLLLWEKELLGLYVSAHPFEIYQKALGRGIVPLGRLSADKRGKKVRVAGIITAVKEITTRAGQAMLFARIEDMTGSAEVLVFPRILMDTREFWRTEQPVLVIGELSERDSSSKILCENIWKLSEANLEKTAQALLPR